MCLITRKWLKPLTASVTHNSAALRYYMILIHYDMNTLWYEYNMIWIQYDMNTVWYEYNMIWIQYDIWYCTQATASRYYNMWEQLCTGLRVLYRLHAWRHLIVVIWNVLHMLFLHVSAGIHTHTYTHNIYKCLCRQTNTHIYNIYICLCRHTHTHTHIRHYILFMFQQAHTHTHTHIKLIQMSLQAHTRTHTHIQHIKHYDIAS
jgi:hypothetical protein